MTIEELKNKTDELIQAIREYKEEKDFDEIELERELDYMLTRLPRDIVYVEWYDRSDIKNMADGIYDSPVNEDTLDNCMWELWEYDNSIMDNDIVYSIVNDTVVGLTKGE
jgi:hypothetical protein